MIDEGRDPRPGMTSLHAGERGAALIVGMIILLVMAISGLSMMNSSLQNERKTSNARSQVAAFLAAEAGVAAARDYLAENWSSYSCAVGATLPTLSGVSFGEASYTVTATVCNGSSVTLSSSGTVANSGAQRGIEFVVSYDGVRGGGIGGAINFVGDVVGFDMPNSNSFEVNGSGGPAITTSTEAYAQGIEDSISDDRIDNYVGGIEGAEFPDSWGTAAGLQELIGAMAASSGAQVFNSAAAIPSNYDYGSSSNMKLTVVKGDLDITFHGQESGGGILVVYGDLTFSGTPSWDGLIIVLGGGYTVSGGGNGGIDGSLFVADVDTSLSTWAFTGNGIDFNSNGGGTSDYVYNCDRLTAARALLGDAAQALWSLGQNCGGSSGGGSSDNITLSSWRESVNR